MDYGIAIPSYIDAWREVQAAEAAGFTHAWFFDSQLIYSDVFATMALAAQHTSRINLGTLVAIPSNRIAPVTAAAIATINKLAPGRVIVGLGTGYTGRNTMGLPPVPVAQFRAYVAQVRGLLAGADVLFREGDRERWIRLMHAREGSFLNIDDPIPIYLAASGPKAMAVVGEMGDGWVRGGMGGGVPEGLALIRSAAASAGRDTRKPYVVGLTSGCVLRPGEALTSPRVLAHVGPNTLPGLHAMWEAAYGPGANLGLHNPERAGAYQQYLEEYAARSGTPADRRYLDVHEGHMVYLKPGEERFVTEQAIAGTLTGHAADIIEKIEALEAAGIDNVAIAVTNAAAARDLIADFGREVVARRG